MKVWSPDESCYEAELRNALSLKLKTVERHPDNRAAKD
jgi:hypothetical protein